MSLTSVKRARASAEAPAQKASSSAAVGMCAAASASDERSFFRRQESATSSSLGFLLSASLARQEERLEPHARQQHEGASMCMLLRSLLAGAIHQTTTRGPAATGG